MDPILSALCVATGDMLPPLRLPGLAWPSTTSDLSP